MTTGDGAAQPEALSSALIATAVDTAGVLPIAITGVIAIQLRADIGLDTQTLGLVFAGYFAAAATLSAPVGRLTERIDPALFLRGGALLTTLVLLAMSRVTTVSALALLVVLGGAGAALTRTTSSVLVARAIPANRQGVALGLRNCAIPLAALLAGIAVPTIALTIGWRWVFVVACALSGAVTLGLPRSVPRPPRSASARRDMAMGPLMWLAVAASLGSVAAASLNAFTAVTAVDAGLSEGAAGVLIAVGSVVGVASRIAFGWWNDQRTGSQLDIVFGLMVAGAGGYALLSVGSAALVWLAVPLAYATGWAFYGSYYLSIIRLNPIAPGPAVGIAQSGAFAGSIVGPLLLGILASRVSFTAAWLTAAAAAGLAAVIIAAVQSATKTLAVPDRAQT